MNTKHTIAIVAGTLLAGTIYVASAAIVDGWLIERTPPPTIGPEVASGRKNDPGPPWAAPDGGLLQKVFWNVDPRCNETGVVAIIERVGGATERYVVPSATDCKDPSGDWYVSRIFDVETGDTARVQFGEDSTQYWYYFATFTPTPEDEVTNTPTATPTATATSTLTPTATSTATPTATATATNTPLPPNEPARCLSVWTEPPLPKAIGRDGFVTDIHVNARNPESYTLFDGLGYLYFETQPLKGIRIMPEREYKVTVGTDDPGCSLGRVPTGLPEEGQPMPELLIEYYIPSVSRSD